jgi:hypothetical protein
MTTSTANWTGLFHPQGASYGDLDEGVEIVIDEWDDDEVTEVTSDMLVAMPEADDDEPADEDDFDPYSFDDVTDELVPLDELACDAEEEDEERPSQAEEAWPRSFDEHKRQLEHATRDAAAAQALTIFGMGDITGCEGCAAAVAKTWEDLRFWEPMLELGRSGDFTGHLGDLRKCIALLEANPPPVDRPELLERWEQARAALRRNVPGQQSAAAADLRWQQNVARGRNAKVTVFHEEVA